MPPGPCGGSRHEQASPPSRHRLAEDGEDSPEAPRLSRCGQDPGLSPPSYPRGLGGFPLQTRVLLFTVVGWRHRLGRQESEETREMVKDREAWRAAVRGVAKSRI